MDWLNGMDEGTRKVVIGVGLFLAALGPVLIVIGKVITAVGTIMTIVPKIAGVINVVKGAFAALNAVMLANPIILIIAAIAALVAAFIYLWNTNEGFRQFWIDLWEGIKSAVSTAVEAIASSSVPHGKVSKIQHPRYGEPFRDSSPRSGRPSAVSLPKR